MANAEHYPSVLPASGDADVRGADQHVQPATLNVLVADSDPVILQGLRRAIQRWGHRCRIARDGREAWNLHRAEHADVIVSGCGSHGADGLELCRKARTADEASRYTHFILVVNREDAARISLLQTGADDCLLKPIDPTTLQLRLASVARVRAVMDSLSRQNVLLRRDSQVSFRSARVDALTGAGNRLRMDEDIAAIWSHAKRYGRRYCAALCDIDWFKSYNDSFGHLAGDDVLRRVAHTIRAGLRRSDILYRFGGDEFLVLLPEQSTGEAVAAMDRVRRAVEHLAIPTTAGSGVVTISIGVSTLRPFDDRPEQWLDRSDQILYAAKTNGRNRVEGDIGR